MMHADARPAHEVVSVPRLFLGAVAGVAAGAVFLVLNMWYATSVGDPAKAPLLMMSTIVKGDDAMAAGTTSVPVGLAVHVVLSAVFGALFSIVVPRLGTNGTLAVAGAAFGGVLYVVNFRIAAPTAFTTFEGANHPFELTAHIVFGLILSLAFFSSGLRRREPVLALER